jgi:hypothetical protein
MDPREIIIENVRYDKGIRFGNLTAASMGKEVSQTLHALRLIMLRGST